MIVRVYGAQLPDTTYSNLLATATQIPLFSLTVPVNLTPAVLRPAIITYSFFGFRQFRQLKRVRISILSYMNIYSVNNRDQRKMHGPFITCSGSFARLMFHSLRFNSPLWPPTLRSENSND